jgi:hypothetical protein
MVCRVMRLFGLCLILGCSSSSKSPPPAAPPPAIVAKPAAVCEPLTLGGYDGTPECKAVAQTPIPTADRTCTSNADCIRLGPHCVPFAIRTDRAEAYSATPCVQPNSGECPPPCAAVCHEGCCVIPPGWGDNCR